MKRIHAISGFACSLLAIAGVFVFQGASAADTPSEFGHVSWGRDFPAAVAKAKAEKKPLMVLFDEVPG